LISSRIGLGTVDSSSLHAGFDLICIANSSDIQISRKAPDIINVWDESQQDKRGLAK